MWSSRKSHVNCQRASRSDPEEPLLRGEAKGLPLGWDHRRTLASNALGSQLGREVWLVIFKRKKLNGKGENLNSYGLLRSLPAPRCYNCICTRTGPCFFLKSYMDVCLCVHEYRIHTSTHTALEMRTAMSCSKALAEMEMPLANLGEPLSPAAIAACLKTSQRHLVKPQPRTVDSFLLMTPVAGRLDPGRQAGTKEQSSFLFLFGQSLRGAKVTLSPVLHQLISQASMLQGDYMDFNLVTREKFKDL